ncbi:FAD-dependent monooxygenase [Antrihabitans cavernicola]|uniref:3-(3-hydroxyphenyl)propionate hydroxylase n=1 Tax=Antrihabitans cavernicola TaxID=2495913 RepID=A0A5A7SHJ1_9NOCA|nr:FAD-dependent monooxygenase [Spelaeibacter cavernicola]KAA0024197.1 3-(3-hydroxyphenyl)propionate hydroxylase [Spelaeibacter cavernicola]
MTDVLIAGAGPTGLALALDLARRGVDVRIVDKAAEPFAGSRGKGLTARTQEVFDDFGLVDTLCDAGFRYLRHRVHVRGEVINDSAPDAERVATPDRPYPSGLIIPQWRTEQILRDGLNEAGIEVEQSSGVVDFAQNDGSVVVNLETGGRVEAAYLVGCDGGRSTIRKALDIDLVGDSGPQGMLLGDVEVEGLEPDAWYQWSHPERGFVALCPFRNVSSWQFQGVPFTDFGPDMELPEPSLERFQRIVDDITVTAGIRLSNPTWLSTWRVNVRIVDRMRTGRVFLAGDAAHIHPPAGGLGMNTGIQDAYNLGWKLAAVIGGMPDALLDTYDAERLPIAQWTLGFSTAGLERVAADMVSDKPKGIAVGAADAQQLQLGYRSSSLSDASTWRGDGVQAGDRAPDAPCRLPNGEPVRIFDVLRGPHFTVLGFGKSAIAAAAHLGERYSGAHLSCAVVDHEAGAGIDVIDHDGHARGGYGIAGDAVVVVRPDGYIGQIVDVADAARAADYLDKLLPRK